MSRRLLLLEADIQAVIAACRADPENTFCGIESTERAISFLHIAGECEATSFNLNMSEDYPDNTILTCSKCGHEPAYLNERIPIIVQKLAKEHAKLDLPMLIPEEEDFRSQEPEKMEIFPVKSPSPMMEEEDDGKDDYQMMMDGVKDGEEEEEEEEEEDGSDSIEEFEDDDQYESDDYYDDEEYDVGLYESEDEADITMHPLLLHDMEQVKKFFGPDACSYRTFGSLGDVDVDLNLDKSFLEDEVISAWGIRKNDDIVCRLHFSISKYLDGHIPKIEVFQRPGLSPTSICNQLKKISESFVGHHWKCLSNEFVQSQLRTISSPSRWEGNSKANRHSWLGFSEGDEKKGRKRMFPWQRSSSTYGLSPPSYEDLHLIPNGTLNGKTAKQKPTLEYGFLYQVIAYLNKRLITLSEFCVVCDEPHIFQNGAMLKPAVCQRELCVFSHQTLGVMQDPSVNIAAGAEVVDLLVAMVVSAVQSKRKHIIFDPYPMVVDPLNSKEFALHHKKKNFPRIEQALKSFVSMREMLSASTPSDVKMKMDSQDALAFPLLQWIISSNRSHILKLPPNKQINFMRTPHQFLLMSSPPTKQAIFQKAKETNGSIFAFHGSNIENWHSILRNGLINASGTKHQCHGAAYGKGIYLSPNSSVSFGYSGMGQGEYNAAVKKNPQSVPSLMAKAVLPCRQKAPGPPAPAPDPPSEKSGTCFLESQNLRCITLCEVISSKELTKHNHVWVCTNPDYVCTRFFFVYEDGKVGDQGVDTTQEKYLKEILAACEEYQPL
ncbi:protein mono-ADP-ribosyltransferase PARP6-like isoform X2 [Apostichopus japonicus]|uniref:protein mono-ADP-ribosyltransferase PARP6-like isoform X2 n=1 Tax=Stichopus japonicus TaxID=307972 RepID=UPI003AB1EEF4